MTSQTLSLLLIVPRCKTETELQEEEEEEEQEEEEEEELGHKPESDVLFNYSTSPSDF